ncbi:MAG: FG-GAP repeat protein [Bacteroidales bacterium]
MKNLMFLLILALGIKVNAQVAINANSALPDNSAMLDISGTSKGVLLPRMTSIQRKAIVNPATGLMVFDTDKSCFYYFDGSVWQALVASYDANTPGISKFASDAAAGDQFGYSVAISGDYAVVGAPYADINGHLDQGVAYIFFRSGGVWAEQAKISASNGKASDYFGYSVAIDGDYVVVGAPFRDVPVNAPFFPPPVNDDQGTVYVFKRTVTTWNQQSILVIADGATGDRFGTSVSVSGNYLVAGAPYADYNSPNPQVLPSQYRAGVAYVFNTNGTIWTLHATLAGGLESILPGWGWVCDSGEMGMSVSISNTTIIAGAPNVRTSSNQSLRNGAAFIFNLVNGIWQQEDNGYNYVHHQINNLDVVGDYQRCGYSVSIGTGGYIMGCPNGNMTYPGNYTAAGLIGSTNSVSYGYNGVNSFPSNYSYFGVNVSAGTQYLVAGSSGSEYAVVYSANPVKYVRKINKPSPSAAAFGSAVAISGSNIIIGAPQDFGKDMAAGAVYFYNLE